MKGNLAQAILNIVDNKVYAITYVNKDLSITKRTVSELDFLKIVYNRETLGFLLKKDNTEIFMFFDPKTPREEEVKLLLKSEDKEFNDKTVDIEFINKLLEDGWGGYIYDDVPIR